MRFHWPRKIRKTSETRTEGCRNWWLTSCLTAVSDLTGPGSFIDASASSTDLQALTCLIYLNCHELHRPDRILHDDIPSCFEG